MDEYKKQTIATYDKYAEEFSQLFKGLLNVNFIREFSSELFS